MAFITSGNQVISFADSNDVEQRDQRLFNENEGLSVDVIEDLLIRSSTRILNLLRNTHWWRESTNSLGLVATAELDANLIVSRLADFTDLCVYHSMYEYILPLVADFGKENSAEREKIGYYQQKFNILFGEIISNGDWYDFDEDGAIDTIERRPGVYNLRRVR